MRWRRLGFVRRGDKLVADLRAARQSAIETQKAYSVFVFENRISYLIREGNSVAGLLSSNPSDNDFELMENEVGLYFEPYRLESVDLSADKVLTNQRFKFDKDGHCTAGIQITLTLGKRKIVIKITTGGEITRVDG